MAKLHGRGDGDFGFDNGVTILVLNRANIARQFVPGGETFRWMRGIVREVEVLATSKLGPGHGERTGDLKRSIGNSVTPVPMGLNAHVRATARHAVFYHEGTRAHFIEPSTKKWLRWQGGSHPSKNGYTYAKIVPHPEFRGDPFLRHAMEEVLALHGIATL